MPQIEAFAEIGDYFDQPVRVYSSGMQMRVAFSVATVRRPDILIVDEALSVGDAYFQHKSFDRIREFRKQGTTLLIVIHDRAAIQTMCDRAILLDGGRLAKQGTPEEVMDYYNALIAERKSRRSRCVRRKAAWPDHVRQRPSERRGHRAGKRGRTGWSAERGRPATLRIRVRVNQPLPRLVLGYMIKDRLGQHDVRHQHLPHGTDFGGCEAGRLSSPTPPPSTPTSVPAATPSRPRWSVPTPI